MDTNPVTPDVARLTALHRQVATARQDTVAWEAAQTVLADAAAGMPVDPETLSIARAMIAAGPPAPLPEKEDPDRPPAGPPVVFLHELTPLDAAGQVVPVTRRLAITTLAAGGRVAGVTWSPREVDAVIVTGPGGDAEVLNRVFAAWCEADERIFTVDSWHTAADPAQWRWALPSAEALARRQLAGRHQCHLGAGACVCASKGVTLPLTVTRRLEEGHLEAFPFSDADDAPATNNDNSKEK